MAASAWVKRGFCAWDSASRPWICRRVNPLPAFSSSVQISLTSEFGVSGWSRFREFFLDFDASFLTCEWRGESLTASCAPCNLAPLAEVVELVDTLASGASARKGVEVQVLFSAPPTHHARACLLMYLHLLKRRFLRRATSIHFRFSATAKGLGFRDNLRSD